MKTSDNLQPQLTTGDFIGLGSFLAYCHHGTGAVAKSISLSGLEKGYTITPRKSTWRGFSFSTLIA